MKHPFQVGDLVRSTINTTNLAIVTKAHKCQTGLFIDVFWLRSGEAHSWFSTSRFTLISRAEQ